MFLLWFVGNLWKALRDTEPGTGRLSAVALGGGVVAAGLIFVGSAAKGAAAARASEGGGISPDAAAVLYDLNGVVIGVGASMAFAVMIGAASVMWIRAGSFPRWFAWASAVLAVGLVTPFNYAVLALVGPWVVVVSVSLYLRDR